MSEQLQPTEQRYSVCVGTNITRADNIFAPLHYAESDAQAVDSILGALGFPEKNRILLLGENATLSNINTALSELILDRPKNNDLTVFYF